MRKAYGYGQTDGKTGEAGHKALKRMTMESGALAQGQDELRQGADVTQERDRDFGDRQRVMHSHSRIAGSVASRQKK